MPLSDRLVRLHWVKSELIICFKLPRQVLWCLCFMSPCAFKECRELVETCQGEGDVDHIGWIWPCHSLKHGSSIWMASEVGMCLWKPIANSGRICLAFLCGQSLLFVTVQWMSPACYLIVRDNDTLWLMEYDVVFRILIMNRWVLFSALEDRPKRKKTVYPSKTDIDIAPSRTISYVAFPSLHCGEEQKVIRCTVLGCC